MAYVIRQRKKPTPGNPEPRWRAVEHSWRKSTAAVFDLADRLQDANPDMEYRVCQYLGNGRYMPVDPA